jgi:hypothetical protein
MSLKFQLRTQQVGVINHFQEGTKGYNLRYSAHRYVTYSVRYEVENMSFVEESIPLIPLHISRCRPRIKALNAVIKVLDSGGCSP